MKLKLLIILILISIKLFSFPELMNKNSTRKFETLNLSINVINGTNEAPIDAPLYASLSAVTDNFIITSFKTEKKESPLLFNDVKIYPSAKFYELAVSYKGVNYFKKFTKEELKTLNNTNFKVYEQGNIKDNIEIERFDYIIEVDEINKALRITEDLVINNSGDFTYSPLVPQTTSGIKIPIPSEIDKINPIFNISENNYSFNKDNVLLKVFLRPGKNYFTFNYIIMPKDFPYLVRLKVINKVRETRVIVPDARNKIVSNLISNFSIRETEKGAIKIGIKKNMAINKDLTFKIMGKPKFKKGLISSTRNSFISIKKAEHFIGYGGVGLLLFVVAYILIFIKPKEENE